MRGDGTLSNGSSRYLKFAWNSLRDLPTIGSVDYVPKGGAFRTFSEGNFVGENVEVFSAVKTKTKLKPFGSCLYCGRERDAAGAVLSLSSEHIIPEFLGAGLELPESSCNSCQNTTSKFELSIAKEMFDPVRKSFSLKGKKGVLKKANFPLDIGQETTQHEFLPMIHYPTILAMPFLFPAASYSRRPIIADDVFNIRLYNINAKTETLERYSLDKISSQHIDLVRFSQMIAKIAHSYAMHYWKLKPFAPTVADFIRTDYPPSALMLKHFQNVGCLWKANDRKTESLHEIEVGKINWAGNSMYAVRVQLFASCGMPSYFVTVGHD